MARYQAPFQKGCFVHNILIIGKLVIRPVWDPVDLPGPRQPTTALRIILYGIITRMERLDIDPVNFIDRRGASHQPKSHADIRPEVWA